MEARMPAALLALSFWFWRAAVAASVTGLGVAALGAGWTSGTLGLDGSSESHMSSLGMKVGY